MRRRDLILFAGIIVLGVVAGILLQNRIWQAIYLAVGFIALGIPLFLALGVLAMVHYKNLRFGSWCRHLVLTASAFIFSGVILVITVYLINAWKIEAVEEYVTRVVPVLDRIKAQSGGYPSRLPVKLIGEPPSLLRDYGTYTATATFFCFEYVNEPAGWAGGEGVLKFNSSTRKWVIDR